MLSTCNALCCVCFWIHLPIPPVLGSQAERAEGGPSRRGDKATFALPPSRFPWPRLGTEPLKVWNLSWRGKWSQMVFPVLDSLTDTKWRAAQPPLAAAKSSKTLTIFRMSWKCSKTSGSCASRHRQRLYYFPWKFPWYLLCVSDLFGWGFLTVGQKKTFWSIHVQWFPALGAEKKEPQVHETKLPQQAKKNKLKCNVQFLWTLEEKEKADLSIRNGVWLKAAYYVALLKDFISI